MKNEILEKVRKIVLDSTFGDKNKITDETKVFKEGFLDSMGLMTLITALENTFSYQTIDSDLEEENFESIAAIANFVMKKTA